MNTRFQTDAKCVLCGHPSGDVLIDGVCSSCAEDQQIEDLATIKAIDFLQQAKDQSQEGEQISLMCDDAKKHFKEVVQYPEQRIVLNVAYKGEVTFSVYYEHASKGLIKFGVTTCDTLVCWAS